MITQALLKSTTRFAIKHRYFQMIIIFFSNLKAFLHELSADDLLEVFKVLEPNLLRGMKMKSEPKCTYIGQ